MTFRLMIAAAALASFAAGSTMAQTTASQPAAGPTAAPQTPDPMPVGPMVGGDQDAHGCAPSTGYTYSTLKHDCIRVWMTGIQLMPLHPQGSATYSATAVFARGRDGRRAELFLYDHKGSVLLSKVRRGAGKRWQGEGYTLVSRNGVFSLNGPDGQEIYRQSDAQHHVSP